MLSKQEPGRDTKWHKYMMHEVPRRSIRLGTIHTHCGSHTVAVPAALPRKLLTTVSVAPYLMLDAVAWGLHNKKGNPCRPEKRDLLPR